MDAAAQQQLAAFIAQQVQDAVAAAITTQSASSSSAQSASPPPYTGNASPAVVRPRLPAPSAYEGAASRLDDWKAELQQQFEYYGTPVGVEQLRFATAFLKGAARDWWQNLALPRPTDMDALIAALRREFQPVTTADTARAKLRALSQGKASVHDYVVSFRRLLVSLPDMGEADRLFQFLHGLKPTIAAQLRMQGVTKLDEAIEKATRVGAANEIFGINASVSPSVSSTAPMELDATMLNNVEGLEQETGSSSQSTGGNSTVTRAELQQMLNAMREQRVGRRGGFSQRGGREGQPNARRLPQIEHLSPQQVREYMAANKCFGCGSTEHLSRQCPRRKVDANGKVSWTN